MTSRPDILLLVLDTQRVDRLSAYGYERKTSPNLDELAADATIFNYGVTPAQWTIPTHTSLFTGYYPAVHRTQQSFSKVPDGIPTLAELLQDDGYYTAAFCNNPLVGVVDNGLRRGFFSFLNYSGWMTSRPNQAGKHPRIMGRYRQFFKRNLSKWVHNLQDSFARSDALLEFAFTPFMVPIWQTALSFKGNTAKSLNDTAKLFIDRKPVDKDQPVFSFVNLMGTHMPFHPNREHIERFAPDFLRDKAMRRHLQRFNSDVLGWLTPMSEDVDEHHMEIISGMYDAEVATQDEHLGVFFDKMRNSGALDNTLVMIVADHGDHLGEKDFIGHTVSVYNELVHVPLIIRDPSGELPRGTSVDQVVSTRRLFNTALTAAGLADETQQAHSLANYGANDPEHGIVFTESITPQNVQNIMKKYKPEVIDKHLIDKRRRAVYRAPYKLILTGDVRQELYNYIDDPQELNDLSVEMPDEVQALTGLISDYELQSAALGIKVGGQVGQNDPQLANRLRSLGYLE